MHISEIERLVAGGESERLELKQSTGQLTRAAETLCGATILDAFHAPSVPASPGSALVFCLRGGGLDVVQVRQRGVVSDDELGVMRESLLADLCGDA